MGKLSIMSDSEFLELKKQCFLLIKAYGGLLDLIEIVMGCGSLIHLSISIDSAHFIMF